MPDKRKSSVYKRRLERDEIDDRQFEEQLNKNIRHALKFYITEKLGFEDILIPGKAEGTRLIAPAISFRAVEGIKNEKDASLIASYVTLSSQEKQARLNNRLQALILIVAASSFLASLLALFRR